MIAYLFLALALVGAALLVTALRTGKGPGEVIAQLTNGGGIRRLAVGPGQVWRDLDAARHELTGATSYIGRLEDDVIDLSRDLEATRKQRDELLVQMQAFDQLCTENTQMLSDLANARAVRQDPRTPPVDVTEVPEEYGDFINATATAWAAPTA